MKKKITMKHIFIPIAIIVVLLAIAATVLSNSGDTPSGTQEYHVHEDGVTHYGEH